MSASYHHNKRFSRKRRNSRELEKYEKQRLPTLESSPSSPWRVESIRASGPPKESDWWITKDANNDSSEDRTKKSSSIFSTISSLSANKTVTEPAKEFCNCGLLTWEESRQKWRTQTVAERPSPPPPVNSADVVAGLTQVQRTYELPGRMTLTSAVELLVEIWECDKDY